MLPSPLRDPASRQAPKDPARHIFRALALLDPSQNPVIWIQSLQKPKSDNFDLQSPERPCKPPSPERPGILSHFQPRFNIFFIKPKFKIQFEPRFNPGSLTQVWSILETTVWECCLLRHLERFGQLSDKRLQGHHHHLHQLFHNPTKWLPSLPTIDLLCGRIKFLRLWVLEVMEKLTSWVGLGSEVFFERAQTRRADER